MFGRALGRRAIFFAVVSGTVMLAGMLLVPPAGERHSLFLPLLCVGLCWASVQFASAGTNKAIDGAIVRLRDAARGDLAAPVPKHVERTLPQLARAMRRLFGQLDVNLSSIRRIALFDAVTRLPNRIHFRQQSEGRIAMLSGADTAALLFIDLDRFKAVNDAHGHAMGDRLLGMVADRLRTIGEHVPGFLAGRLAGDEFTIFVTPDAGETIGPAVCAALRQPFDLYGTPVWIGASVGISRFPQDGTTLNALMAAADAAMYQAKASGRGRVAEYGPALATVLAERDRLADDLRVAIDEGQFALVFQPQRAVRDGRIVAAEALLRWNHPTEGVCLPSAFLARAEETGLIVEIGDWVIAEVAATITRWARLGISQRIAVNLGARQVDRTDAFAPLRKALSEHDAPARLLELEIDETLAMHCSDEALAALAALRQDGATVALDGYGGGYSSIPRLRTLPIDRIKLDRSLLVGIADSAKAQAVTQAIVGLVHGLGLEAVAQGVENAEQAEMLRVIGCDAIQGYAVGAPIDEAAFLALVGEPVRKRAITSV